MFGLDDFDDMEGEELINPCKDCYAREASTRVTEYMKEINLNPLFVLHPYHLIKNSCNNDIDTINQFYFRSSDSNDPEFCEDCFTIYSHEHLIYDKICFNEYKCICCQKFKLNTKKNWVKNFHKSLELFKYARQSFIKLNPNINHIENDFYRTLRSYSGLLRHIQQSAMYNKYSFVERVNNGIFGSLWGCRNCFNNMINEKIANRKAKRFNSLPLSDCCINNITYNKPKSLKRIGADAADPKDLIQCFITCKMDISNMY